MNAPLDSDAPKCLRPGCRNRVQFNLYPSKGEPRWREYCSRRCVGLMNRTNGQLAKGRMLRHAHFHVATIRAAVGPEWKSGDPVTLQQLIAMVRLAYKRGWQTRNMRDEQRLPVSA